MRSSTSTADGPDHIGAASCQLYLVTPPRLQGGPGEFAGIAAAALDAGPVACLQLRLKDAPDDEIRGACDVLRPVAQERGVAFVMNDRADLAAETGCDGVHVGQEDIACAEARTLVGPDAIVGVTCKSSRHLALEACEAGADYVAFGAFFASSTKAATTPADPDILSWWQEMATVPCVAIGGITVENCAPLVTAGADFLAVASGVWDHAGGPAAAVREFASRMA